MVVMYKPFRFIDFIASEGLIAFQAEVAHLRRDVHMASTLRMRLRATLANNPQQSWGFEGEPPEAVIKDFGTRDGTS